MYKRFEPRIIRRAESEKPSTIATREREARQLGLQAGVSKIKRKWRTRRYRAILNLRGHSIFQKIQGRAPEKCEEYERDLTRELNLLRAKEVKSMAQWWEKKTSSHVVMRETMLAKGI
jgi:hypothetical protein